MTVTRFTVRIAAPLPEVYAYFADPRNRPEWQSSLRRVEMLDEGEPRVGMRWRDITVVGMEPLMEITGMHEPTVWSESGRWRGLAADLVLHFASERTPHSADPRESTEVMVTAGVHGRGPWALPGRLVGPVMPIALRSDVRRAARLLERRAGRG